MDDNIRSEQGSYKPSMHYQLDIPSYEIKYQRDRSKPYCLVVPVINEGARIQSLLAKMSALKTSNFLDIIIVDGGSTDGSLINSVLVNNNVTTLLVKTAPGKLSAQLRCAYAFALEQGYSGVITIDGNDKDDPTSLPLFLEALQNGYDFAQGSRFVKGGIAENTPLIRHLAIRLLHAPVLSFFSGFPWTDTTQGYRAYSIKLLKDPNVAIFRSIFADYELLAYLSYKIPKLGLRCIEIPVARRYPKGEVPTKISSFRGNLSLLKVLFLTCFGFYDPPASRHAK